MFENKNIAKQRLLAEMHAPRASKENISDTVKKLRTRVKNNFKKHGKFDFQKVRKH